VATTELPAPGAQPGPAPREAPRGTPQDAPLSGRAVPQLVPSEDGSDPDETLITDLGLLQTLLAVDGRRTVDEITAGRGPEAGAQLQALARQGLIRIDAPAPEAGVPAVQESPAQAPPPAPPETPPARETAPQAAAPAEAPARAEAPVEAPAPVPVAGTPASAETDPVACPKLGFWDNAASHYSRPTQLHRCFASGGPAPLTADQQVHLCLTRHFTTCPRLAGAAGAVPVALVARAAEGVAEPKAKAEGAPGKAEAAAAPAPAPEPKPEAAPARPAQPAQPAQLARRASAARRGRRGRRGRTERTGPTAAPARPGRPARRTPSWSTATSSR
jgi:hypothetical protein